MEPLGVSSFFSDRFSIFSYTYISRDRLIFTPGEICVAIGKAGNGHIQRMEGKEEKHQNYFDTGRALHGKGLQHIEEAVKRSFCISVIVCSQRTDSIHLRFFYSATNKIMKHLMRIRKRNCKNRNRIGNAHIGVKLCEHFFCVADNVTSLAMVQFQTCSGERRKRKEGKKEINHFFSLPIRYYSWIVKETILFSLVIGANEGKVRTKKWCNYFREIVDLLRARILELQWIIAHA